MYADCGIVKCKLILGDYVMTQFDNILMQIEENSQYEFLDIEVLSEDDLDLFDDNEFFDEDIEGELDF